VSPLDVEPIIQAVLRVGKLLVVEEGTTGFDLASEVIAAACQRWTSHQALKVRRLGTKPIQIPSSLTLERAVLPSEADIVELCLELFDT
jgi:pyruvate/2-oxoglutarate/acetoin dehydrogenase E1 component